MESKTSQFAARTIAVSTLLFGVFYSCASDSDSDEDVIDPDVSSVLTGASQCIVSSIEVFQEQSLQLVEAIEDWEDSPEDSPKLAHAREAWDTAMGTWQALELMQLGPAGTSDAIERGGAVGGQDLRDEIYSWRLISPCRIDEGLVDKSWEGDFSEEPVNARGLDALEYLLFNVSEESSCPTIAAIIADGDWDALTDLPSLRAAYALAAARDVAEHAEELELAWAEDGGDFAREFADAGNSGVYPNQKSALNALTDALFYIETVVKDMKLAVPLGIHDDCTESSCPEEVEHQHALRSLKSLEENVRSFQRLFEGCGDKETLGLADYLREKGAGPLADEMDLALDAVVEAIEAIGEDDFIEALEEDKESVQDLYDAVKVLTDLLKSELTVALGVDLPKSVGGDND